MARFLYILLVIVLFGVLIAIHEFGHFITAKLLGVKVNEFAIGMGPCIWHKETEETQYSIRLLLIGVSVLGTAHKDTEDERCLARQGFWRKL